MEKIKMGGMETDVFDKNKKYLETKDACTKIKNILIGAPQPFTGAVNELLGNRILAEWEALTAADVMKYLFPTDEESNITNRILCADRELLAMADKYLKKGKEEKKIAKDQNPKSLNVTPERIKEAERFARRYVENEED